MLKSPAQTLSPAYSALLVFCLATALIFFLHQRPGIRDVDAFSYAIGAYSLHAGHGYQNLTGEPLNHWPPGYSLLLSPFINIVRAAMIVQFISFGAATALLYYLLRQSRWSWQAAAGLSAALASGFFRILASAVHPDIMTYALFLLAILLAAGTRSKMRTLPSLLWAFLIPLKLIAVVFLPPALVADRLVSRQHLRQLVRIYLPGILLGGFAVFGEVLFNKLTIASWIPRSIVHTTVRTFFTGVRAFFTSIPREFLFNWHGSVMALVPGIAFSVALLLAAICLCSLRFAREQRWFLVYAVACLVCSALLLCVRTYDPSVRLTGYSLIVLFLAFRPKPWANSLWLLYGLVSLVIAFANATAVNSLGSNDPRYADLARQVAPWVPRSEIVATNSFHLLDLHARIPSVPVDNYADAAKYNTFLWVTLPDFDPGSSAVTPMPHPGTNWCEKKQFAGAVLFSRCSGAGDRNRSNPADVAAPAPAPDNGIDSRP